ncbi:hypothetical protein MJ588_09610 [Klebsiella pneumoniae]|nr:hypothetical protein MJ588_09610 [Klebsiella pneumoniae]
MFTAISESRIITVMVLITTASALRNSVSSVRARALGSGRPWISDASRFSIRLARTQSANGGEEEDRGDADQHIHRLSLPDIVVQPFPGSQSRPRAAQTAA